VWHLLSPASQAGETGGLRVTARGHYGPLPWMAGMGTGHAGRNARVWKSRPPKGRGDGPAKARRSARSGKRGPEGL